jgi:tRNA(Ile)-lysidine synthase
VFDKVIRTISRHSMLAPGSRVVAAVSGGPDSICLLEVLRELAPRFGAKLCGIAHVNHKWRGEASDEDERFVARIAAQYGLAFYRHEVQPEAQRGNLEDAARQIRRGFFAGLIENGTADRVATGHTLDDQAETVLFRLLRGAGIAGLAGILPIIPLGGSEAKASRREGLIRPLLEVSRAEVERYLRLRRIEWREDATNRDRGFARNRIRHALLPQLAREWNPHIREVLAHTADIAREEEGWREADIDRLSAAILVETPGGWEARAPDVASLPKAVARRLMRRLAPGLDFEHVERILDLAARQRGEGRLELPGIVVERSFDWIRVGQPGTPSRSQESGVGSQERGRLAPAAGCACRATPLDIIPGSFAGPGRYAWPGGFVCVDVSPPIHQPPGCVSLKLQGRSVLGLQLRAWRAGDRYRPTGSKREYILRELFQRARVPIWQRRLWPILSMGPEILWARQFGVACGFFAQGPDKNVVWIWEERGPTGESPSAAPAS